MRRFLRWLVFGLPCKRCGVTSRETHWTESMCLTCGYVEAIKRTLLGGRK